MLQNPGSTLMARANEHTCHHAWIVPGSEGRNEHFGSRFRSHPDGVAKIAIAPAATAASQAGMGFLGPGFEFPEIGPTQQA